MATVKIGCQCGGGGDCSIFFGYRKEILQVDWEGNVVPCCFDYDSQYVWGNLQESTMSEIFSSKARYDFLDKAMFGEYIHMCEGCPR